MSPAYSQPTINPVDLISRAVTNSIVSDDKTTNARRARSRPPVYVPSASTYYLLDGPPRSGRSEHEITIIIGSRRSIRGPARETLIKPDRGRRRARHTSHGFLRGYSPDAPDSHRLRGLRDKRPPAPFGCFRALRRKETWSSFASRDSALDKRFNEQTYSLRKRQGKLLKDRLISPLYKIFIKFIVFKYVFYSPEG